MTVRRQSPVPHAIVPHGLWTLDCPHGAKMLLGWLHSHTDEYLASLSHASIARLLGTSPKQVREWCARLAELGLLVVERGEPGEPNQIVLTDAYRTLSRPGTLDETVREPESKRSGDPGRNGHAEEEQLEEQLETTVAEATEPAPASATEQVFEQWWKTYPNKQKKKTAFTTWRNLTKRDRDAAIAGLPAWVAYWRAAKTEMQHIPHPSSWLRAERWNDTPPSLPGARQAPVGFREPDEMWADGDNVWHRYPEHEYR